jgi:hypothetical protein
MKVVLFSLLLMSPINQSQGQHDIQCPKWIGDGEAVAPQGVDVSEEQKRNNTLRCYWQIVKPLEWRCKRDAPNAQCEQRTNQWLNSNFQTATTLRQACQQIEEERNARARTIMINIREVR